MIGQGLGEGADEINFLCLLQPICINRDPSTVELVSGILRLVART